MLDLSGPQGAGSRCEEEATDSQSTSGTGQRAKGKITEGFAYQRAFTLN
jgi:hypothetical protein